MSTAAAYHVGTVSQPGNGPTSSFQPVAEGRIFDAKKGSVQKTKEFVGCQTGLANDPPQRPDRKIFSLWDDDQTWRIASNDHRSVAPFATARSVFESGLSKRGDDLSS